MQSIWISILALCLANIPEAVHGQTAAEIEDGAIGNVYVKNFEDKCSLEIDEYLACRSTKNETKSTCYNENLDLLECTRNCPDNFDSSWICTLSGSNDCILLIYQWLQCAKQFCADNYLVPYGQCVAAQKTTGQCSSCPKLVAGSESTDLLTLTPTCAVFEKDYCEWQSCCEPCQYFLNFYGRCLQVNFKSCQDYFEDNPSLPSCPLQVTGATPPQALPGDIDEANDGDGPTNDAVGESSPTTDSFSSSLATSWSLMVFIALSSFFFMALG